MVRFIRAAALAVTAVLATIGGPALSQDYPTRTITLVPSPIRPAAGSTPWRASSLERLTAALGQNVVVENRGGGGGNIGIGAACGLVSKSGVQAKRRKIMKNG